MLKMKKMLGISLAVLFLLSVTAASVSATQYLTQAPPDAQLGILCLQGKDIVYPGGIESHVTQVGTTAIFLDNSKGQVLWKKWYVDGKLV